MSTVLAGPLASALFPKVRAAVVGLLFGHPDESFYLRAIVAATGLGVGHVQRELARLVAVDVLRRTRQGRHVYFQANSACPIYDELRGIALKTTGAAAAIRQALEPLRDRISAAFLFGSVARGEERQHSDVDLLVIGQVTFADVVGVVRATEGQLRREVNPIVYAPAEVASKLASKHHFLTKVLAGEKLFLLGSHDELADLSRQ